MRPAGTAELPHSAETVALGVLSYGLPPARITTTGISRLQVLYSELLPTSHNESSGKAG